MRTAGNNPRKGPSKEHRRQKTTLREGPASRRPFSAAGCPPPPPPSPPWSSALPRAAGCVSS
eukprot:3460694-Lingulodinium_polyedra.AAC.1